MQKLAASFVVYTGSLRVAKYQIPNTKYQIRYVYLRTAPPLASQIDTETSFGGFIELAAAR